MYVLWFTYRKKFFIALRFDLDIDLMHTETMRRNTYKAFLLWIEKQGAIITTPHSRIVVLEREQRNSAFSPLLTEGAAVEKGTFFIFNITKHHKTMHN